VTCSSHLAVYCSPAGARLAEIIRRR